MRHPLFPVLRGSSIALLAALATGFAPGSALAEGLSADVSESVATEHGVPGGVITRTAQVTATVKAIDYATRSVTLADDNGEQTFKVGPQAVNFDQVQVGDTVTLDFLQEVDVYLHEGEAPAVEGAAVVGARAAKGAMPGAMVAGSAVTTAKVTAIDKEAHSATLEFTDGMSAVVPVRPDVTLSDDQVGKTVVIRETRGVAVSVEKSSQ